MKFLGTGSALPKKVVSNDDLAQVMDTSDEWIRSRTGIGMRHIAVEETTTSMAVEAAEKALADAKISGCEIDLIIAGTISPDYIFPSLACEVQAAIGAKSATAFDLSAGCSGFLFALATADAYFRTGRYKHALVIGAETLSKMMNWADRSTCVLFGDGAGAAVVSAEGSQLFSMVQGSDGAGGMALHCENRPVNNLYRQLGAQHYAFTQMDGREVYKFAVRTVPKAVSEALEQAELPIEDVKYFLLHQANIRIIESVAKRLHQPMEKFPCNLQKCGNVSAASVPILLDNVHKHGMISGGDKIVLAGFGAGLTWGHVQSSGRSHQIMKEFNMTLEETLNDLLVKLFKDILEIEAKSLITEEFKDISYNDMHIIEAVGIDEPRNMKTVAKLMSVTTGTLTKAMDALCEKGYVVRERSTRDKRVIKLRLTDKGKAAYYHHEQFHRQMIKNVADEMNDSEKEILVFALAKLVDYFKLTYYDTDEESEFVDWSKISRDK